MSSDADQFLDLIAENAQIKAEILALRQFSSTIREFDQAVVRSCVREVKGSDRPHEDLVPIVSKIRMGLPAVESAESFKQRMVAERMKKLSDAQRVKLAELDEKIGQAQAKKKEIGEMVQSIQNRVDEHRRFLLESQAVKDNITKQVGLMRSAVDSLEERRSQLSQQVSHAQAAGLEMRRSIEQAHRDLNEFTENGSRESKELASIRKIVSDLRTQMKKKPNQ
jgi:chromosome segregation ATPase